MPVRDNAKNASGPSSWRAFFDAVLLRDRRQLSETKRIFIYLYANRESLWQKYEENVTFVNLQKLQVRRIRMVIHNLP